MSYSAIIAAIIGIIIICLVVYFFVFYFDQPNSQNGKGNSQPPPVIDNANCVKDNISLDSDTRYYVSNVNVRGGPYYFTYNSSGGDLAFAMTTFKNNSTPLTYTKDGYFFLFRSFDPNNNTTSDNYLTINNGRLSVTRVNTNNISAVTSGITKWTLVGGKILDASNSGYAFDIILKLDSTTTKVSNNGGNPDIICGWKIEKISSSLCTVNNDFVNGGFYRLNNTNKIDKPLWYNNDMDLPLNLFYRMTLDVNFSKTFRYNEGLIIIEEFDPEIVYLSVVNDMIGLVNLQIGAPTNNVTKWKQSNGTIVDTTNTYFFDIREEFPFYYLSVAKNPTEISGTICGWNIVSRN